MAVSKNSGSGSPLEIKLFATAREATEDDLRGTTAIIVDVLRSSSSIAAAIHNGAREIIPVMSPAEAGELLSRTGRGNTLLCGEREGRRIDGFDLGNSPLEYTADRVGGRILIFSSTNGTPALLRAKLAERVYIGGYNNFSAALEQAIEDARPLCIVCSGKLDHFAIEDFVCAGRFVTVLESRHKRSVLLNDAARAASLLHKHFDGRVASMMKSSEHGKYLAESGFETDVEYCSRMDIHPVIPVWSEGKIRGLKSDARPNGEPAPITA